MANRGDLHAIMGVKDNLHLITAKLTGAGGTDDLVIDEASNRGGGEITAAEYDDTTGQYALTFRHSYPELKSVLGIEIVGDTAGLQARFLDIDVSAKTATILFEVAGTPTVLAATDTAYINLLVRNSGFNT